MGLDWYFRNQASLKRSEPLTTLSPNSRGADQLEPRSSSCFQSGPCSAGAAVAATLATDVFALAWPLPTPLNDRPTLWGFNASVLDLEKTQRGVQNPEISQG